MTRRRRGRAVITGMGIICGIGHNKHEVLGSIRAGRSGIREITKFDVSMFNRRHGCEIQDFDPVARFSAETLEYANASTQYALTAVDEALKQSGIDLGTLDPHDIGLCVGSSHGALDVIYDFYKKVHAKRRNEFNRNYIFRRQHGSILKVIANRYRLNGMVSMVSTACASSTNALGIAADWIWNGISSCVLAGGSDVLDQSLHAGFWALKALAAGPCSPFSGDVGISLGEGSAFFIVEELSAAQERGAPILAEIKGYGLSGDAYHATSPDPQGRGVVLAIERALSDAAMDSGEVEYVNAHGTGTDGNDSMEAHAFVNCFGARAASVPMSSTKSYFGHATGAAGALEACVSIMCMQEGILPPTVNFGTPRYPHPIDYIPNEVRKKSIRNFVSNSFGFAGNNAVLVIGCPDDAQGKQRERSRAERAVVTGIGVVSPIGVGYDEFVAGLSAATGAVGKVSRFDTAIYPSSYGCLIAGFDPNRYNRQINADRRMDLVSQYSTVAASLCLNDAGVPLRRKDTKDIGIVMCVSSAPRQGIDEHLKKMLTLGPNHPSSIYFPYSTQNSALGHVSINLGLQGLTTNLHVDGCSGLNGLVYGQLAVETGREQRLMVGGGDEVSWSFFEELSVLDEVSKKTSPVVPFSEEDRGFHPGEGGVFLLLESRSAAAARGARVYAELIGFGVTIDSNDDVPGNDPSGSHLIAAVQEALDSGGIRPEDIGWIGCSERGIEGIRSAERRAIEHFWGGQLDDVLLVNTSPFTGWLDSVSPLLTIAAMIAYARKPGSVPNLPYAGASLLARGFERKSISDRRRYALCLGVSREGYNYAVAFVPGRESAEGAL